MIDLRMQQLIGELADELARPGVDVQSWTEMLEKEVEMRKGNGVTELLSYRGIELRSVVANYQKTKKAA